MKKLFSLKLVVFLSLLAFIGLIINMIFIGLAGIVTNDYSRIVGTSTSSLIQEQATLYDRSKSEQAGAISTQGWDAEWVNKFRMDAGDPPYVNGEYIDNFLSTYYPDSPLIGYGNKIKTYSDYYGVSVGAFMGQIAKETTFGRAPCGGQYNFGCIMWREGWGVPSKFAVDRDWIDPPTIEAGIESYFNLVRYNYLDKGYVRYDAYLERYSPSFENDQSTFKNLMWGALKAFGYDTNDTTTKKNYSTSDELVDGKMNNFSGSSSASASGNSSNSSSSIRSIDLTNTRLSALTLSWRDEIESEMTRQGVDLGYLPLLLGILQNESGGGGVVDIFQASESRGWSMNDPRMTSELMSIQVGVEHFKNTLEKTKAYGKSDLAIVAGYNFGHAFLDYLNRTNQDWTIEVAREYSGTVVAPSLGNTTRQPASYVNEVSMSYNIPYYYWNGGNFHYVPMLLWHLGYDLEEIKQIALNGSSDTIGSRGKSREEVLSESYTYFGDSLVAGTATTFKQSFTHSNVFGTPSMQIEHKSNSELDAMTKFKKLLDEGKVHQNVIIQLGTNRGMTSEELDRFVALAGTRKLYFITTASDVKHAEEVASVLKAGASKYSNVYVFDWLSYVGDQRFNYYGSDRIHFNSNGATTLISFIIEQLMASGGSSANQNNFTHSQAILNELFTFVGDDITQQIKTEFDDKFKRAYVYQANLNDTATLRGLEEIIVLSLGNTSEISQEKLETFINEAGNKTIYLVTPSRDESTTEANNTRRIFTSVANKYDNVTVFDWYGQIKSSRSSYYEGNNLNEKGIETYLKFIAHSLEKMKPKFEREQFLFNKFLEGTAEGIKNLAGGDLVEIAMSQIGLPYSWGGGGKEGPTVGIYDPAVQDATNIVGFDCSGFMQYIYYQAYGIDIGDWTVPQETSGTRVNPSELEVGDLLFWGSSGATYHVAMYIGDDQLIESSTPGNPISIRPMRGYDFAIRVDIERLKAEQGVN